MVAFDLDDTLAVTTRDRATLLSEAVERVGAPPTSRAAYRRVHRADIARESREPIFETLLPDDADVSAAELAATYRTLVEENIESVPGAADLVRALREEYRVGLLTDGPVRAQRGKLAALGWSDLFDTVVVTGRLPAGKPDSGAFEALLSALEAAPAEAVHVGDAPEADVRGASDAGLAAVQVLAPGDSPVPAADAAVRRERLAAELPATLRELDAPGRHGRA